MRDTEILTAGTKTGMTNTAKAGKFSSDRTSEEYATEIWKLTKTPVEM